MAFLRAGLFLFTLLACITFAVTAPIPNDQSISRRQPTPNDLLLVRRQPVAASSAAAGSLLARRQLLSPVGQGGVVLERRNIFKKLGQAIKKGFQKAGNAIKNVAKKVVNGVKNVAKKVGNGIKTAAKKVGKFVKEKGAAIAKFGLKLYSTAVSVAGRVASFVPGVGKVVGKALNAWSKVTNFAADKIKAKMPGKLEKGFKVMDKIQHPFSGAAGKVFEALT